MLVHFNRLCIQELLKVATYVLVKNEKFMQNYCPERRVKARIIKKNKIETLNMTLK